MKSLADKAVVVTGAGRGLGRAYALAIAAAGGRVVVNDIDLAEAEAACEEIRRRGGAATASGHSVVDPSEAQDLVDLCAATYGAIDGLVNNAGLFHTASPLEEDADRARRLVEVNVLGVLNCSLAAVRRMSAQGRGAIINIISGAVLGMPRMSVYGASKGAVLSLTLGWAIDLEGSGISVVAVSPVAETRMTADLTPKDPGRTAKARSRPEDIAPLIVHLLGGGAAAMHGRVIRLAGGELSLLEPVRFGAPLGKREAWDAAAIANALQRATDPDRS